MLVKLLPYHSLSLTACTMMTGMMIGAKMETSTATMAPPSQWTGSTMVSKTVPMAKTKWTWADLMTSSCAMMVKQSQWSGSTMEAKTVLVAKMKWARADPMMEAMLRPTPTTTVQKTKRVDSVLSIAGSMSGILTTMEALNTTTVTGITNVSN